MRGGAAPHGIIDSGGRIRGERGVKRFPDWTCHEVRGGMSLWLRLPKPVSAALSGAARELGLKLEPGPRFFLHQGGAHNLRLPFSRDRGFMMKALERLEQAWAQTCDQSSPARDMRPTAPVF